MAAFAEEVPAPSGITNTDDRSSQAPSPRQPAQLARKRSMRTIIPVRYDDSSEDTPSDHSSLFNAVPSSWKTTSNDSPQRSDAEKDDSQDAGTAEPTSGGTCAEKRSDLENDAFELDVPAPDCYRPTSIATNSSLRKRRQYQSVDENALLGLHDDLRAPHVGSASHDSYTQSPVRQVTDVSLQPAEPPFQPPVRKRTPMGVSRWPADAHPSQRMLSPAALARPTSMRNLRNTISRILRGRPSHETRLREMLHNGMPSDEPNGTRVTGQPGRRLWRPPVSAQTGRTIGSSQLHVFNTTQKPNATTSTGAYSQRPPIPERRLMAPLPQAPCREDNPVGNPQGATTSTASTGDSNATMSLSQRALSYASGYAVPVSPHRVASKRALRSAALPSHLRPPSVHARSPAPSSSVPDMGTMRTDDLLQSFPQPPSQLDPPRLRPSRSAPGKRPSWSLFPRANGDESRAVALRPLPSLPTTAPEVDTDGRNAPDADALTSSVIRSFLEETHGRFFTARTSLTNVNYGQRQSSDRHERQQLNESTNQLPSPASRAHHASGLAQDESELATAQLEGVTHAQEQTTQPELDAARPENSAMLTATPTRVIQGPQLCKHKLAKMQAARQTRPMLHVAASATFDGSNASPVAATEPIAQDHADFGPRIRTSLASTNLTVLPPAPVGSTAATAEPQANAAGASSPSAPQIVATAPAGTTFVTNPGGSTFAISPYDPHYRPGTRATTFNTLQSGPSEHDRA
ncbi:hypothetical protein PRZ48_006225 [Zasmidium cellare]|uniref:Uncharacterized protein n=1 Tax=Zasmidium cellare TaxID=395010 RepID=A0ABR0EN72_ZASCE|nr:hypothetical protein PRZ48_006225 [Zasmidium cellare]